MTRYLVLQVLGNSDVQELGTDQGKNKGSDILTGFYNEEGLKYVAENLKEDIDNGIISIDFPLIQRLHQHILSLPEQSKIHWLIILTNQVEWMKKNEAKKGAEGWQEFVATDGCWWRSFLELWFKDKPDSQCSLIDLSIDPEIENGAADWDAMARTISPFLNKKLQFKDAKNDSKILLNEDGKIVEFNQLIIQHSSGTPALSSALYLWGIEQKLAGYPVAFAYLNKDEGLVQDSISIHEGGHWQWRLKKPQVMKLLELQDFSGSLQLLGSDCPDEKTLKSLQQLDKRSAFNLRELNLSPQDDVLERIAIALWTEKVLRQGGQWMNWYLRVAGAMELALFCLVEQGSDDFEWQSGSLKTILHHSLNNPQYLGFRLGIEKVATELLADGESRYKPDADPYLVTKIQDDRWQDFCDFYRSESRGWQLDERTRNGFTHIRNNLYHSLSGDRLDELLDKQTQILKSADHPEHPAHKAVGYLLYLLELGSLKQQVMNRRKTLQQQEKDIFTTLETLP